MKKLRSRIGRSLVRLRVTLRTGRPLHQIVYYTFFSNAFRRERVLVAKGHQEYNRRLDDGTLEFLLRRNIHMLEKGLTMQPRRETFAVDYISETVTLFGQLTTGRQSAISTAVEEWAREVLARFSEATAASDHPAIIAVRQPIVELLTSGQRDFTSGPHAPFVDSPPVQIDALLHLAERRKSVRWFDQHPVPRDALDRAMQVASEAPSACNRQPFTFRIFDDPDLVEQVAKIPMGTAGYGHNLPGIVAIVGDLSAFIDERDRHLIYTDGCLAAMSFIFGLESQGIASVCINWPDIADRDRRMSKLLNLAPHERVVMLIGFGYADHSGLTPFSAKRSLDALRSYNAL